MLLMGNKRKTPLENHNMKQRTSKRLEFLYNLINFNDLVKKKLCNEEL